MHPPTYVPPVDETSIKRKALSIGITYGGTLPGPHKDVEALSKFLTRPELAYDVTTMMDEPEYAPDLRPTRANILDQCKKLVEDVKPGHRILFHYSGHSDQIDQEKGSKIQERDFKDEAIVPEDAYMDEELSYIKEKMILDDVLFDIFFQRLPPGSNFVAIMDTCHSGTMLALQPDLPHVMCNSYTYKIHKSMYQESLSAKGICLSPIDTNNPYQFPTPLASPLTANSTSQSSQTMTWLPAVETISPSRAPSSMDYFDMPSIPHESSDSETVDQKILKHEQRRHEHLETYVTNMPARECMGNCPMSHPSKANVIAFAACGDPQLTLETPDGSSMTRVRS
ncbi:hypothetical protein PLICRDRAFT_654389 [Plicaturopsis crispa FD-325 SS-3]|nr:hypothetical protein PLICRDRAFT_654389 [Plicaturopsis crispa FD-325 SS-3]